MFSFPRVIGQSPISPEGLGALPDTYLSFDADNDGDEDLVYAHLDYPTGTILTGLNFLENVNGTFVQRFPENGTEEILSFPGRVLSGDFNGDGLLDIYVGTFGNEILPGVESPDEIYINQGNWNFVRDANLPFPATWSHGSVVGDLNNDGRDDIFATGMGGAPSYQYLNTVNGWVIEEMTLTQRAGPLPGGEVLDNRDSIEMSLIEDLDGDGYQDLVIGTWTQNHQDPYDPAKVTKFPAEVYWGSANGLSTEPYVISDAPGWNPFDTSTFAIASADLNGDGLNDLVLGHSNDGSVVSGGSFYPEWLADQEGISRDVTASRGSLQVLLNNGDRTFLDISETVQGAGNNTRSPFFSLTLNDYNRDGHIDIFGSVPTPATDPAAGNLLFLNNGSATGFTAHDVIGLAQAESGSEAFFERYPPNIIRASDYDNDGDPDLLYVSYLEVVAFENISVPVTLPVDTPDADSSPFQIYRFFNSLTGSHFFTTSISERNSVITNIPTMTYEGNAFDSNATEAGGGAAVYRFYNSASGVHFYTASADEAANIRTNLPQFVDEGIVYYASLTADGGGTALYRFLNTQNGTHFYTTSEAERDNTINTLGHYTYEGVAYYVDLA